MAHTPEWSGTERRRIPRYPTHHPGEATSPDHPTVIQGTLCDLSVGGCRLRLEKRIPPGKVIEARCDIGGIALRLHGEVVWTQQTGEEVFHGLVLAGFPSEDDARFCLVYVTHLARQSPSPSGGTTTAESPGR